MYKGGWRYRYPWPSSARKYDSDLSVTAWNLLFLHSAKNAGFQVPVDSIDRAVVFVQKCYRPAEGTFGYQPNGSSPTRAMAGAGMVSLSMSGYRDSEMARSSAEWLLNRPFDEYNAGCECSVERYHYAVFFASTGFFLLGEDFYGRFFPGLAKTLMENQRPEGSWDPESYPSDTEFGNAYTTALVVLSLSLQDQMLPILQR
jgi:hypothetical protein